MALSEPKVGTQQQSGHDVEIREFCRQHDIEYQSFWTLTGNPDAFNHQAAQELAKQKKLSPEAVRRFVLIL